jgi:hypothetical protein
MPKSGFPQNPWKFLKNSEWKILVFLCREKVPCDKWGVHFQIGGRTTGSAEGHPNHFDSFQDLLKKGYIVQSEGSPDGTIEITPAGSKVVQLGKRAVRQLALGGTRA